MFRLFASIWIIVIILFAELDATPYSRDTSFSRFLGGLNGSFQDRKGGSSPEDRCSCLERFREKGLAGIGIADLMKEAGLTVGGFYKHFSSRDELVAEAIRSALGAWKRKLDAAASGGPPVTYESLVDEYLSEAHRDHPGTGCPVSALAADIARTDKRTRALITRDFQQNTELLANSIREAGEENESAARSRAIMAYCGLVGAITMARAVSDKQLSGEILKTVAQLLTRRGAQS